MTTVRAHIEHDGRIVCAGRASVRDWPRGRGWFGTFFPADAGPLPKADLGAGVGYTLALTDGRSFPIRIDWVHAGARAYVGIGPRPEPPPADA
jgi:hypothetical protein